MTEFVPDTWKDNKSIIKVIGVGGGGSNAVNQMYNEGMKDVEFMVCNTDSQALAASPVPNKLQLGTILTKGLGAGCNPEQGRNAALESLEEIKKCFEDMTQMVFITAGMGGGTGTGAAPVIAKVAKEMGLLTVAVVTQPFKDEGTEFLKRAYEGIMELSKYVDSLLIIDNQKLYRIYGKLMVKDAFPRADKILSSGVRGIAEIITNNGYINVDFADVKMVMKDSGMAIMGTGEAAGENRTTDAVENAFSSPLLNDFDLKSAKSVLINIYSSSGEHGLTMSDLSQIMEYVKEYTGPAQNLKRGVVFDPNIKDDLTKVTVVATGFKMHITPPVETKPKTDPENIIIVNIDEEEEEEKSGEVILTPTEIIEEEMPKVTIDRELSTVYTPGMNISDLENETALARRQRLSKEKKEKNEQ